MRFDIDDAREHMEKIKEYERLLDDELAAAMSEGLSAKECRERIMPIVDELIDWRAQRERRQGNRTTVSMAALRRMEEIGRL